MLFEKPKRKEKPKGKRKEKRKGLPNSGSRLTSCLTMFVLLVIGVISLTILGTPRTPPPLTLTPMAQTLIALTNAPAATYTVQLVAPTSTQTAVGGGLRGKIAYVQRSRNGVADIYIVDASGGDPHPLTNRQNTTFASYPAAWSPDGQWLLFLSGEQGGDIFIINADGTHLIRLTTDGSNSFPVWLSNGTQIGFASSRDGSDGTYRINTDGSAITRLAAFGGLLSPDGQRIAFEVQQDNRRDIYVRNTDGSHEFRLTNTGDNSYFAWSPDGQRIAFASNREGDRYQIYTIRADGSHLIQLTTLDGNQFYPTWLPDGTRIAFASGESLYVVNADGTNLIRLDHLDVNISASGIVWSR